MSTHDVIITERMAVAASARLLMEHGPGETADAFLSSRIRADHGAIFGTQSPGPWTSGLVERATRST